MEIKEGYTRISKIIGQWNQFAHIDPYVLENKCRIGTNVHKKIDAELHGIFIEPLHDEKKYFESWEKWWEKEENNLTIISHEKRFYCDKLKLTGCIDALVTDGNRKFIIDYKTSASVNKKTWSLQAAFYHYLVSENELQIDDEVLFLKLKKDGKTPASYRFKITPDLWSVCQSALSTYRYFND